MQETQVRNTTSRTVLGTDKMHAVNVRRYRLWWIACLRFMRRQKLARIDCIIWCVISAAPDKLIGMITGECNVKLIILRVMYVCCIPFGDLLLFGGSSGMWGFHNQITTHQKCYFYRPRQSDWYDNGWVHVELIVWRYGCTCIPFGDTILLFGCSKWDVKFSVKRVISAAPYKVIDIINRWDVQNYK